MEQPVFQEAARCDVCKCSFTTFRRRHHCRCCGRTLCAEHSSNQMALPQFGIHSLMRVCADCFNDASSRSKKDTAPAFPNGVSVVTDSLLRLDMDSTVDADTKDKPADKPPVPEVLECKCGMPLCICAAPILPSDHTTRQEKATTHVVQSNTKPKKADSAPKSRGSTSNSRYNNIFNPGQVTKSSLDKSPLNYEANGEGLREAIKNGDTTAVKKLLSQGVDANYRDKQGSSLLHLAAVFNQTEIAFALMDHGASLDSKNPQGETPLDCAPATLQYRMKKKIEESMHVDSGNV